MVPAYSRCEICTKSVCEQPSFIFGSILDYDSLIIHFLLADVQGRVRYLVSAKQAPMQEVF